MNFSELIEYVFITFIGSIITIIPYVYEKIKNLTRHKKITIIGVMMIVFMSIIFTLPLFPLIPHESSDYMVILLISLVFAAYLSNVLSYFYSPTKSDLVLLKEYDISIDNRTYATIKYIKEEYKSYSNYIFWALIITVLFLGVDFSIILQLLLGGTVEDEIPIIIFLTASIIANIVNIIKTFSPIQYYVKYICPHTNKIFEGFKLDKNTIYNNGEIIEIPPNSQIIEEKVMRKYLGDITNKEIENALEQLNKIDVFLYVARKWYKLHDEDKMIKNKTILWLSRRRINKNKKVWVQTIEDFKRTLEDRDYLINCYKKIKCDSESVVTILKDCNLTKTLKEAVEDDGMGRV